MRTRLIFSSFQSQPLPSLGKFFLVVALLVGLAMPVSAGYASTFATPIGTPGANAATTTGYFAYNASISGTPLVYTIQNAGVCVYIWSYWLHAPDHTARFNLSYNNHNYSTVKVTLQDLGPDTYYNGTCSGNDIARAVRVDYLFEWNDPDIISLPGTVQLKAYGGDYDAYGLYDNITNVARGGEYHNAYLWYSSVNNTKNVTDLIGMAPFIGNPYGMVQAKDGFYEFYYGAGYTPPESTTNSSLAGYVNNAYTNATVAAANIYSTQGASVTTNVSMSTGYYKISNMIDGVEALITASKTGYFPNSFTFTPNLATAYTGNISLIPSYIPNKTAIVGIAYGSLDGNPVQGATVTIENATWSDTYTTAVTGFYIFDNLAGGESYDVSATAPSFTASAKYPVTASAGITTTQNIPLTALYTLTVEIKDGFTGTLLLGKDIFVQLSDGQTANTTFGTISFTVDAGAITATATTSEYATAQQQAIVTADTTITLLMYKITEATGVAITVPPHHVKFIVRNQNGYPLDNVLVTAQGEETTVGPWDWFLSIFGVSGWVSTPIHNTSLSGTTDSRGEIDFLMFPEIRYNMSFTKAGFIQNTTYLYPHYDEYQIFVPSSLWLVNGSDINRYINWSITRSLVSDTDAAITVRYNDTFSHTTKVIMDLRKNDNRNPLNRTPVTNCSWTGSGGSSLSCTFHVADYQNAKNNSYWLNATSISTDFGMVMKDFPVDFPLKGPMAPFKLPDIVLFLISALLLICVGMMFGATSVPQGALIVCVLAWILTFLQMMNYMTAMNPIGYYMGLGLATVTAVFANFRLGARQEGYP